jgi:hypothetical protein
VAPEGSSRDPLVVPLPEAVLSDPDFQHDGANAPPISADPPERGWTRRLSLPHISPKAIDAHRQYTIDLCNRLIDGFLADGKCDAAGDGHQIPPAVIAHLLGIDEDRVEEFTFWVRNVLEYGLTKPELRVQYRDVIREFFEIVAERAQNPKVTTWSPRCCVASTPTATRSPTRSWSSCATSSSSRASTRRGARSDRRCGTSGRTATTVRGWRTSPCCSRPRSRSSCASTRR